MAPPKQRKPLADYNNDDEIIIVSEKFVNGPNTTNTPEEDNDDVVFVSETRVDSPSPYLPKPTIDEYLAIRDGTIPKILGRTARLKHLKRTDSSSTLRSPRVVSIAEYTRATMNDPLNDDDDDDDDDGYERQSKKRGTPKRRLHYDDSSDEDNYTRRRRKKRKLSHALPSIADNSNLLSKTLRAENIDESSDAISGESLKSNREEIQPKRNGTPSRRFRYDESRDNDKYSKHKKCKISRGKMSPCVAVIMKYANGKLSSENDDKFIDEQSEGIKRSPGKNKKRKSLSGYEESAGASRYGEQKNSKSPQTHKSPCKLSAAEFGGNPKEKRLINRAIGKDGTEAKKSSTRVVPIAEYVNVRKKSRTVSDNDESSCPDLEEPYKRIGARGNKHAKSSPRKPQIPKRRRVEDSDEFSNSESEEMFGRKVCAMDRTDAKLVDSPIRVASIAEYINAQKKSGITSYNDESSCSESEELGKRSSARARKHPRASRCKARVHKRRRIEDSDEFSDSESEEMFGRRVCAMDRPDAKLVESSKRVVSIAEYINAQQKSAHVSDSDESSYSESGESDERSGARTNEHANASPRKARIPKRRRVEDSEEFSDTESEELFERKLCARDRAEAKLVES